MKSLISGAVYIIRNEKKKENLFMNTIHTCFRFFIVVVTATTASTINLIKAFCLPIFILFTVVRNSFENKYI